MQNSLSNWSDPHLSKNPLFDIKRTKLMMKHESIYTTMMDTDFLPIDKCFIWNNNQKNYKNP